jgi:hypothetical protein
MRTIINIVQLILVYNIIGILWMIARLNMKRFIHQPGWSALHFISELIFWPITMPQECYRAIRSRIRTYKNK